ARGVRGAAIPENCSCPPPARQRSHRRHVAAACATGSHGLERSVVRKMSTATAADLLRTDHLVGDIGRRTAHGMAFTLASQLSRFGLQLGSTAVLARALTPRDFG